MELSVEEKRVLLDVARKTIKAKFDNTVKIPQVNYVKYPILKSKGGAFVTLTINEELRGCIGFITSDLPLPETVSDAAHQAAFGDPRFPSLTDDEFDKILVEVSILSEPFPMQDYDEIELGKHGLILAEGDQRGLLLPQVPIEHHMTKEEYLDAICRKAGFYEGMWRERKLAIQLFTATVFSENDLEVINGS